MTLQETIRRMKQPESIWEDRLRQLAQDFEDLKIKAKRDIEEAIKSATQDFIFSDLEPAKALALKVAKAEISAFKEDVNEKVQSILQTIKETKQAIFQKVVEDTEMTQSSVTEAIKLLLDDNKKELGRISGETSQKVEQIISAVKELRGPQGIKGNAGEDANPEDVVPLVLAKLPPVKDLKPETPDEMVEKINNAKKKVLQSSIDGLVEMFDVLKRAIREKSRDGGGGGGMGNVIHQHTAVNSATTTVTTVNKIAGSGFALTVYYNGQMIARGTDYTVGSDFKTLTLLFAPADNTVIDIVYFRG